MENRIQRLFLSVLLFATATITVLAATAPACAADDKAQSNQTDQADQADQVIEPDLQRRELTVPKIHSQDFEVGLYYGVLSIQDFGSNPVWGSTLAYHVTEDIFFEGEYGSSQGGKTSFEKLSGSAQLLDNNDRKFTYYDISVGWDILPGEVFIGKKYAFNSAFYLIGGIGGVQFAGDDVFAVNIGAGYRLLLTDWLAIHVDARDYMFNRDIFGERDRANNLELRTGVSVFF